MRTRTLLKLFITLCFALPAYSQVIISEFMADNVSSAYVDEDGSHEDWIEITNLGNTSISLNGWYLTDEGGDDALRTNADLRKWQFPVASPSVVLTANGTANSRLVVWCSNKNRKSNVGTPTAPRLHTNFKLNNAGEHIALVRPDGVTVEHEIGTAPTFKYPPQPPNRAYGVTVTTVATVVMPEGGSGKYIVPATEPEIPSGWNTIGFDDSAWPVAVSGLGYGFTNLITVNSVPNVPIITTTIPVANRVNTSVYVRFPFTVANPAGVTAVRMKGRFDDGVVCYLNGVEIGSNNKPSPLLWNSFTTTNKNDTSVTTLNTISNTTNGPLALVAGTNVLAFQVMNSDPGLGGTDNLCIRPTFEIDTPSGYATGFLSAPTLGAANGTLTTVIPPDISQVTENPTTLPTGGVGSAPILVSARVTKTVNNLNAVNPVQLKWRRMYDTENTIVMLDDGLNGDVLAGDGIFSAQVPTTNLNSGEMIRWRIEARDNLPTPLIAYAPPYPGFSVTGSPANPPPIGGTAADTFLDIAQYYGTMASATAVSQYSQLPVLYWFIKAADATTAIGGTTGVSCSMFYRGQFYDNVYTERHGQSSAGFPVNKKSFNFNFTKDNRLEWSSTNPRVRSFNLLTNYADKSKMRTPVTWKFWEESGHIMSHWTETVRVHQVTDTNSTNTANHFWGIYDIVEDGNEDMLERYGFSPADALYKVYDALGSTANAEQKTREDVDATKADYQAMLDGLLETKTIAQRRIYGYDNVDISAIVNAIAVHGFLVSQDWGHKNFYMFRDTLGTGEWSLIPWDQDLSLGHTWNGNQGYWNDEIDSQRTIQNGATNRLKTLVYNSPEINRMLVRRVRTLMDRYLGSIAAPQNWFESQFTTRLDQMDPPTTPGGIKSDAQLDFEKWGFWVHGGGGTSIAYTDSQGTYHSMRAQASRLVSPFTSVTAAPWNYPGYAASANLATNSANTNSTYAYLVGRRRHLYNLDGQNPGSGADPVPAAQSALTPGSLLIETIEYSPASGNGEQEYFAIRNNTSEYIDISGWTITGPGGLTSGNDNIDYKFRGGTVIPPYTTGAENIGRIFVAKNPTQFRARSVSPKGGEYCYVVGPFNGRLTARGSGVELRDINNAVVASASWAANPTPAQNSLRITELNFRPAPASPAEIALIPGLVATDFEYIELTNTSASPMNLGNAYFDKGVTFTFPAGFTLAPGQRCLVVASQTAFETRYGTGFNIAGEYEGSLDNGGETIRIFDSTGEEVLKFTYDDDWFPVPAGQYRSFVTRSTAPAYTAYDTPTTWALSESQNGTPTSGDTQNARVFEGWRWDHFTLAEIPTTLVPNTIGALTADPDNDGMNNFTEFAFGRSPKTADHPGALTVGGKTNVSGTDYLCVTFRRAKNALDVTYIIEVSTDLSNPSGWLTTGELVTSSDLGNGTEEVCYRDTVPMGSTPRYIRVRAVKP